MDFEQDLRNSLQHSADAIGSGDSSLEAIRSRGRRRKALKAAGNGFALVLVIGVGALGLAAVLDSGAEVPVADTTVVTEAVPTTATPPTTVVAPPPTGATAAYPVPFSIEADEEFLWVGVDGAERVVYDGRYHAIGSDGLGGLVFQVQISVEDSNRDRAAIFRVAPGTTEPVVIVAQEPGHLITMLGVENVDGSPTLLYTDRSGMESPETARSVLVAYDLASGTSRELAVVGGWESGIVSISYGGGLYVMEATAESESWFRYLDREGNEVEPAADPHPGCQMWIGCPRGPVMTDDGKVVFHRSQFYDADGNPIELPRTGVVVLNDLGLFHYDAEETLIAAAGEFTEVVAVVAADLSSGDEVVLRSAALDRQPGQDGPVFLAIDVRGDYLIVSDRKEEGGTPPTVVTGDDEWSAGTPGVGRFPLAPFDLPGVVTSPFE
jgi:hypothetical protein